MKDDAERARECLGKLVAESGRYSSVASHAFSTQGRDIFILASDAIELAVAFAQQPTDDALRIALHASDVDPPYGPIIAAFRAAMLDAAPIPGEE